MGQAVPLRGPILARLAPTLAQVAVGKGTSFGGRKGLSTRLADHLLDRGIDELVKPCKVPLEVDTCPAFAQLHLDAQTVDFTKEIVYVSAACWLC